MANSIEEQYNKMVKKALPDWLDKKPAGVDKDDWWKAVKDCYRSDAAFDKHPSKQCVYKEAEQFVTSEDFDIAYHSEPDDDDDRDQAPTDEQMQKLFHDVEEPQDDKDLPGKHDIEKLFDTDGSFKDDDEDDFTQPIKEEQDEMSHDEAYQTLFGDLTVKPHTKPAKPTKDEPNEAIKTLFGDDTVSDNQNPSKPTNKHVYTYHPAQRRPGDFFNPLFQEADDVNGDEGVAEEKNRALHKFQADKAEIIKKLREMLKLLDPMDPGMWYPDDDADLAETIKNIEDELMGM